MATKTEDAAALAALFKELRQRLSAYQNNYKEFFPGLFDGPRAAPAKSCTGWCRLFPDRLDLIKELVPRGGLFAEVGTLYGDFIVQVLDANQPREVHLFDLGFQNIRPEHRRKLNDYGRVHYHQGESSKKLSEIPDSSFDVVYIDGDHSYQGVWQDLTQGLRALKPAGYLICNDYTNWDCIQSLPYGVLPAVNRFMTENSLVVRAIGLSAFGFHDIALQRA
jgi:SAM-dependent methyltransferase